MDYIDVSTELGWLWVVASGLMFVLALWMIIAPDKVWWVNRPFVAWQYKDGDRMELSFAGRLWTRFSGVLTIAVIFGVSMATVHWTAESRVETEPNFTSTVYYLRDPVDEPGCTVRVFICLRYDEVFPIEISGYETLDSVSEPFPADTNLLLRVGGDFFPTHVVVEEEGSERVIISLYGKCAPRRLGDAYGDSARDCVSDSWLGSGEDGLVPVTLDSSLGSRSLIDGSTGGRVEPT